MKMYSHAIACGGLFLVFCCVTSSAGPNVHCKMKPGCTIPTQCDPMPIEWSETGYMKNPLFSKEFPITCSISEIDDRQNKFTKEIEDLKMENSDLKIEFKMLEKLQEKSNEEIGDLRLENRELKNKIQKIEKTNNENNKQTNKEIEKLKEENADLKIKNKKLEKSMNDVRTNFDHEIEDLKKQHEDMKVKNEKWEETLGEIQESVNQEIGNLRVENREMKTKIQRIEKTNNVQGQDEEEQDQKISNLEASLATMNEKLQGAYRLAIKGCPIPYKDKCYVPKTDGIRNVSEGRDICAGMSGKLANIYDKAQMDYLFETLRNNHMVGSAIHFRTGMTINPQNGQVKLSDGRPAPYSRWEPGYPLTESSYTNILLAVRKSPSSRSQYMWNAFPSYRHYILCEI